MCVSECALCCSSRMDIRNVYRFESSALLSLLHANAIIIHKYYSSIHFTEQQITTEKNGWTKNYSIIAYNHTIAQTTDMSRY